MTGSLRPGHATIAGRRCRAGLATCTRAPGLATLARSTRATVRAGGFRSRSLEDAG
jgi:hypothetical protein